MIPSAFLQGAKKITLSQLGEFLSVTYSNQDPLKLSVRIRENSSK
jgi:hypothetical protein